MSLETCRKDKLPAKDDDCDNKRIIYLVDVASIFIFKHISRFGGLIDNIGTFRLARPF